LEEVSKGENIVKWTKDKLARSPGENGGKQNAQEDLHSRTEKEDPGRDRKGSSSARSEEMERVGDR
jgi:hypothetical protein